MRAPIEPLDPPSGLRAIVAPQGWLSRLRPGPKTLTWMLRLWPTYAFAGIRVREIAADYTQARVVLRLGLLNRNFFGTAFGGSLYAMTDPFFALLMIGQLGPGYRVWDRAAQIRFLKPGTGVMTAEFHLPAKEVARVRRLSANGAKVEPVYRVQVRDASGAVVAEVDKVLYVRRL